MFTPECIFVTEVQRLALRIERGRQINTHPASTPAAFAHGIAIQSAAGQRLTKYRALPVTHALPAWQGRAQHVFSDFLNDMPTPALDDAAQDGRLGVPAGGSRRFQSFELLQVAIRISVAAADSWAQFFLQSTVHAGQVRHGANISFSTGTETIPEPLLRTSTFHDWLAFS